MSIIRDGHEPEIEYKCRFKGSKDECDWVKVSAYTAHLAVRYYVELHNKHTPCTVQVYGIGDFNVVPNKKVFYNVTFKKWLD